MNKTKVAVYCRVSTNMEDQINSLSGPYMTIMSRSSPEKCLTQHRSSLSNVVKIPEKDASILSGIGTAAVCIVGNAEALLVVCLHRAHTFLCESFACERYSDESDSGLARTFNF